jgi:hypothetical protein
MLSEIARYKILQMKIRIVKKEDKLPKSNAKLREDRSTVNGITILEQSLYLARATTTGIHRTQESDGGGGNTQPA